MADSKITDLGEITAPAVDDVLAIVDVSAAAAADKNKKIQLGDLGKLADDGSATAPSIGFQSDPNTGFYSAAGDSISAATNGSHRATLDSTGRLLINRTSTTSDHKLQVVGTGEIDNVVIQNPATDNIAVGTTNFGSLTTGDNNTALGPNALESITTANACTAVGHLALKRHTTGTRCTAVGSEALQYNTTGRYNVAIGVEALNLNTDAEQNTACGDTALGLNTTGDNNTGVGRLAGTSNQTGNQNTAVGSLALGEIALSRSYSDMTAVGYRALHNNENGNNGNTAIGSQSCNTLTTGSYNTCLGMQSGEDITTGSGNIVIGDLNASGISAPVHTITTADNRVVMGSTAVTNAYIQVAWTTVSDERDKLNFAAVPHGIDFVKQLNPVAFQFRQSRESDVAVGPVRYGFKAQEVMALEGDAPVIIDDEDPNRLKYQGESLVPVLVNAMKEQQQQIEALQVRLNALEVG